MTIKTKKFTENILKGDNQTQAFKKAGFKAKNDNVAYANSSRLIRSDKVKAEIERRKAELQAETAVTINEILNNARYLIALGKAKNNGADIAAGNKQLGETIAAFKQGIDKDNMGLIVNVKIDKSSTGNDLRKD